MSRPADASVIHDIGYRRYQGRRLGTGPAMVALYAFSLQGVFGLGRAARYKVLPFGLLAVMCLPAVVSAAITTVTRMPTIPYAIYVYFLQAVVAIFLAAQTPS